MPTTGPDTRTQIMDAAQDLILEQGFAGTTVDRILEGVGVTKGAFFHHFRSKQELAHALVERFAAADREVLVTTMERAERLSRDPVQQLLIFVGLLEESASELTDPHPGCLFASYCYEAQLFDEAIHGIIRESLLLWRERLGRKLRAAIASSPPRTAADPEDIADLLTVVAEGSFILSRSLKDPAVVARQFHQYRLYLELLFGQEAPPADAP